MTSSRAPLLPSLSLLLPLAWTAGCTIGSPYTPLPDAGPEEDAGPRCPAGRTACESYTFYRCAEDGRTRLDPVVCEGG
jgi:hypothetical protein